METRISAAFRAVPRERFLPAAVAAQAGVDAPLPIGYGQTNSQPSTVALMIEWLAVEPGQHVLDVGSGSGWTSALLAWLAGPEGSVVAVEVVPELVEFGRRNCKRTGARNITFHKVTETIGYPAAAPYDRILVSAAAREIPATLPAQLAAPGRLVIPVGSDVLVLTRDKNGTLTRETYPGFLFVPLV